MEDIAPELYKEIQKLYTESARADSKLISIVKKAKAGKATQADLNVAAERLGKHASTALKTVLTIDSLPDGKLYWNIAEKTIRPTLEYMNSAINGIALMEKRSADIKHGVKLALQTTKDQRNRIRDVMTFATNSVTQPELTNALTDPVITTVHDFLDEFEQKNAEIRENAGVKQYVIREYDGVGLHSGACDWCLERAGTWDYQDAKDNGVFERHPGCGCTIEVVYEDDLNQEADYGSVPF